MSGPREHDPAAPTVLPIGVARTGFADLVEALRQPCAGQDAPARIELRAECGCDDATSDLHGFGHLWVTQRFHRARGWRPRLRPPRRDVRHGVFATRSPHGPIRSPSRSCASSASTA